MIEQNEIARSREVKRDIRGYVSGNPDVPSYVVDAEVALTRAFQVTRDYALSLDFVAGTVASSEPYNDRAKATVARALRSLCEHTSASGLTALVQSYRPDDALETAIGIADIPDKTYHKIDSGAFEGHDPYRANPDESSHALEHTLEHRDD